MEKMAISKFKAKCLAILERVKKTHKPILITRFGEPVAEIIPPRPHTLKQDWVGSMSDTGEIIGDAIEPASDIDDWEALKS